MARRSHSVFELRGKLGVRNYEQSEIDGAIARLIEAGYLDDAAYCRSYAEARIKRMRLGPGRIKIDLERKGFDDGLISETLSELFKDDDSEMVVAIEAAKKKIRSFSHHTGESEMKRKLYDHLARRGFSQEMARRIALDQFKTIFMEANKLYG